MNISSSMPIFLSTPLSAFSESDLRDFVAWCRKLEKGLSSRLGKGIYCAALKVGSEKFFDSQYQSVIDDFSAIENCSAFVLIYPKKLATSALIELGFAAAKGKPILIIAKEVSDLPFMAMGLSQAYASAEIFICESFSEKVLDKIVEFCDKKI